MNQTATLISGDTGLRAVVLLSGVAGAPQGGCLSAANSNRDWCEIFTKTPVPIFV